jgi:hypothetical protein
VFENRALGRIFGPKREEVVGGWRRLHNEELHNLYASPNIVRVIKSRSTTVYPKVSGLAAWSENRKRYIFLPLGSVVSLFCGSV